MKHKNLFRISLQYFAEGEAGGSAEGAGAVSSEQSISQDDLFLAEMEQQYGITNGVASAQAAEAVRSRAVAQPEEAKGEEETPEPPADTKVLSPEEEFDALVKGKFKSIYGQRLAAAVRDRFKNNENASAELAKYQSTLSQLAGKYGKAETDYAGIMEAISKDDSLIEDAAIKEGLTTDAYRERRDTRQELAKLRNELTEREKDSKARADAQRWAQQSQETVKKYPDFDIRKEMNNPDFVNYLTDPKRNYTVTEAYEHAHLQDILAASVQAAINRANEDAARSVQSNLSRFKEGASAKRVPQERTRKDIRNLSDADFDEIDRRLARGERITEDFFI